jgi:multiple sugar transport system substrate-binding protein
MPTIKDIAQYAGVSHGTVSNVLNKRGNVCVEKINLVQQAIEKLGYKVNTQAKQLRQGKTNQVAIILPKLEIARYIDLYLGMNALLTKDGYDVTIHCSNDSILEETLLINTISASNPTAIVIVSVSAKAKYSENSDIPIYFLLRKVISSPKNSAFIVFDYYKIGCDMANRCILDGYTNIACFCGPRKNLSDYSFYNGCRDTIEESGGKCTYFSSENTLSYHTAFTIVNDSRSFDSIIALGVERAEGINTAINMKCSEDNPKIYCACRKSFNTPTYFQKYEMNYKYCGNITARKIIEGNKEDFTVIPDRFPQILYQNKEKSQRQINFLALQSPTSDAINLIVPKFTRETGIKVKIMQFTYEELYNKAKNAQNTKAFDIIRLDMAWLTKLGSKIFKPLNLEESPYKELCESFLPAIPRNYFETGGKVYSLPFDTSTQLLYYRRDLFEDALIKRAFFETTKRQLKVPTTYEEFDFISRFFTRKINPESPTKYGTSMIRGSSAAISCELLPRMKASGVNIFNKEGKVVINSPQMKEIVKKYINLSKCTSGGLYSWWNGSIEEFAKGDIAMTIVFGNHASRMVHSQNTEILNKIGFAPIPGGYPLLGGGVLGISQNSEKKEEVDIFLKWVYSKETTDLVNYLGGHINSKERGKNIDAISLYPWTMCIEESFLNGWRRPKNINPKFDEFEFEQTLGAALSSIVAGLLDIDEGLDEAQKSMDEIFN